MRAPMILVPALIVLGCGESHVTPHVSFDAGIDAMRPADSGLMPDGSGSTPVDRDATVADADAAELDAGTLDADAPSSPDASVECTAGDRRLLPCECMGVIPQYCFAGAWISESGCVIRGRPCRPRQTDSYYDFAACQTRTRSCTDDCHWGAWFSTDPEPECYRGSAATCDPATGRSCVCTSECRCEPNPECVSSSM